MNIIQNHIWIPSEFLSCLKQTCIIFDVTCLNYPIHQLTGGNFHIPSRGKNQVS